MSGRIGNVQNNMQMRGLDTHSHARARTHTACVFAGTHVPTKETERSDLMMHDSDNDADFAVK